MILKGVSSMATIEINEYDYDSRRDLLRKSYPSLKDKQNKPAIVVNNENHTVVLSGNSDPRMIEYFLKVCLKELLDEEFACMIISNHVWNERTDSRTKVINPKAYQQAMQNMHEFEKNVTLLSNNIDKLMKSKSDIVLPDFLYFFNTATENGSIMPEEKAQTFTDELAASISQTCKENNLQSTKFRDGK